MPQVQLDDEFLHDADHEADNFDHLFTPQVVARLDQISADMQAGKNVSIEEVDKHLRNVGETWLKNRDS